MGQLDLFLACFGMARDRRAASIAVDGRPVAIDLARSMRSRANIGISLVPEDRKTEACSSSSSGKHNASLPVIDRFAALGLIDAEARDDGGRARSSTASRSTERALWTRVGAFSGGNQQKIAIAKWLLAESRVLLLYDPTRGIDVGTKHEIYLLMRDFAEAGGAVLFYSTEIPELVHLCRPRAGALSRAGRRRDRRRERSQRGGDHARRARRRCGRAGARGMSATLDGRATAALPPACGFGSAAPRPADRDRRLRRAAR